MTLGIIASVFGINAAAALTGPRRIKALATRGDLPPFLRNDPHEAPVIAIAFTTISAVLVMLSATFLVLAKVSVLARFVQYLSTCASLLVFGRRGIVGTLQLPVGPVIPVFAIVTSFLLVGSAESETLLIGGVALVIGAVVYFIRPFRRRWSDARCWTSGLRIVRPVGFESSARRETV